MNKNLLYLSLLQTGLTYLAGFATAEFFATSSDAWGFMAVTSTIFLLMAGKWETYNRIEALLGPLPSNEPIKDPKSPSKDKADGVVGFALPNLK